jgi:hypothetical protein
MRELSFSYRAIARFFSFGDVNERDHPLAGRQGLDHLLDLCLYASPVPYFIIERAKEDPGSQKSRGEIPPSVSGAAQNGQ